MPVEVLIDDVSEGSTSIVTVAFTDENGSPFVPTEVYAQIDCDTEGSAIRAETIVSSPASSMQITVTPAENDIHDTTNEFEIHEITIRATYGTGQQLTGNAKWKVRNLEYLP